MDDSQIYPELPEHLFKLGWRIHFSLKHNKPYFFNINTEETTWDQPSNTIETVMKAPLTLIEKPNQKEISPSTKRRFHLGGQRYAVVRRYRKATYVNIREYHGSGTKSRMISGKGINLKKEEWDKLYQQSSQIQAAMETLNSIS